MHWFIMVVVARAFLLVVARRRSAAAISVGLWGLLHLAEFASLRSQ